ncbi:MAG: phosphoribosylformylglycinamidine synthase subunit PurL [Candidatus Helarchaeota archaeon]
MVSGVHVDLKPFEIEKIKKMLKRTPNMTEIGMIDVMWSEHCSYKSSRPVLKLLPTEGSRVIIGPGQDAGVVDIGEDLALVFKIESHNHPSAIEPYNGAATGIGGIVRDILCMGARPIGLLDPLRFGNIESGHSRWLFQYVVKGIADYGNCIGVPTIGGEVEFDESFETNCLVNVGCLGIAKKEDISPSKASNPGDLLILMGGSTGRDGLGGVTFASRLLTEESEEDRPAVQIGDPFTKKLIIEATLEALNTGYINGLKDFGGGGLTCVTSELAEGGGTAVEIDLDKVFLREPGMIPYEIMLSESQERMMFVVSPEHVKEIIKIFKKYDVPHAIVGRVIEGDEVIVKKEGEVIARLPATLLADSPTIDREAKKPEYIDELKRIKKPVMPKNFTEIIYRLLKSPNIACKSWVYTQYDHEVGDRTVVKPGQGDAAVLRILNTNRAVAIASDGNSKHCYLDPYNGAAGQFAEACRNVVAVGAEPIAMVNCLNFGDPEKPEVFWTFKETVRGMTDMCKGFNVPCVGGNVSFYNEDNVTKTAIKPSPVIMIAGLMESLDYYTTLAFKNAGDAVLIVGETFDEMGGSEYYKIIHEVLGGIAPKVNIEKEKNTLKSVLTAIRGGLVTSAHDCSKGGIAITIAEMAMKGKLGAEINIDEIPSKNLRLDEVLFSESHGRFILTINEKDLDNVLQIFNDNNVICKKIGNVLDSNTFKLKSSKENIKCNLDKMIENWTETIPKFMGAI